LESHQDLAQINFYSYITGLEKLQFSTTDAFETIKTRLNLWNIDIQDLKKYCTAPSTSNLNHGVVSALYVLNIIDSIYYKKNENKLDRKMIEGIDWGAVCYDSQIIDAVSAIMIHDILHEVDNISFDTTPIAYLLVLCDTLQEWNRPSRKRKVYNTGSIRLDFHIDKIICQLNYSKKDVKKIRMICKKLHSRQFVLEIP
jgi:hypothetical protein